MSVQSGKTFRERRGSTPDASRLLPTKTRFTISFFRSDWLYFTTMTRKRQQRTGKSHFAILVNQSASGYRKAAVDRLISAIRDAGGTYTFYEPESAIDLLKQAEVTAGSRRSSSAYPAPYARGGKVTSLIACGGDGTFNLCARAALSGDLPVGCVPLGKMNNIAKYLYGSAEIEPAIKAIISGGYRQIDVGRAADIPFFGSVGLGFIPHLLEELSEQKAPRFALGWSQLGARIAGGVTLKKTLLKVDSFRFEIRPIILNVNLLPYSAGLPLTPASIADDGHAEIVFDQGDDPGNFASYTRLILKKKYLYGNEVRLYRGKAITCQPVRGRNLYLDGEMISVPNDILEIQIDQKQLSVFC